MTGHAFDRSKQRISRRRAKAFGLLGFAAAAALPIVLWHHAMGVLATGFHPTLYYFVTGWTPFGLMALGLLLFVPVVYSIGLSSYAPAYPRRRNVYAGWGSTLYLLGIGLASQVAAITHGLAAH
jgi:MFS family permease